MRHKYDRHYPSTLETIVSSIIGAFVLLFALDWLFGDDL